MHNQMNNTDVYLYIYVYKGTRKPNIITKWSCLTSPSVFNVYDKVRKAEIFMDGLASGDSSCKV